MNEMALLLGQRRPAVSSSLLLDFFCGRRFRSCGSDRGLSDRPLNPFGADSPMLLLEYSYSGKFGCPFLYRMCKGCVEVTCCVP